MDCASRIPQRSGGGPGPKTPFSSFFDRFFVFWPVWGSTGILRPVPLTSQSLGPNGGRTSRSVPDSMFSEHFWPVSTGHIVLFYNANRPHCAVLQFQQATLCGYHTVWVCGSGCGSGSGSGRFAESLEPPMSTPSALGPSLEYSPRALGPASRPLRGPWAPASSTLRGPWTQNRCPALRGNKGSS